MQMIDYARRNEMLLLHRDVTPNAYQRGLEDCRYLHRYFNPFPIGSHEWWEYCRGNEDARKAARLEKI
jgi:hypothetical protein